MEGTAGMQIYSRKLRGHVYFYAQRTFREKIDPGAHGKTKGSGKSRVRTEIIYLGTAEHIVEALTSARKPLEVRHRAFGFVAAVYQTAVEIGLVELLKKEIEGERFGVPRWLFFLLAIVNRLERATSKARMGQWAANTILPSLLGFDPKRLNSQTFWYVTDDVVSERQLRERREENPELADALFAGLDDAVFRKIEEALAGNLQRQFHVYGDILLYDTTNFFTYIEEPVRSKLARTGHNKDCHHHLRQVGLALCVDKQWGIPLFYRLYRGNCQDAKTFGQVAGELVEALRAGFTQIEQLVLVLDKGNNSEDNFAALQGQVKWIGSLTPSHYEDLMALPLKDYEGQWGDCRYHRDRRTVMGVDCALVLTYSDNLKRKQEHSLDNALQKLEKQLRDKWDAYKRRPKRIPAGLASLLDESHYKKCLKLHRKQGELVIEQTDEVDKRRKHFGKNLLFCANTEAESGWIIEQYRAKDRVEDDFKLLKDPELIRWRPCRHWTDTKIRAFGFCCVMALVLIRVMELKAARAGIRMSPRVLKEELADLQEITMVLDSNSADIQITARSTIQQRLWDLFNLGAVENELTRHNPTAHPKP
jgi:transposase